LARPAVIAVTVLTSLDAAGLARVGVARPLEEQVATLAGMAAQAGLDGVVASPARPGRFAGGRGEVPDRDARHPGRPGAGATGPGGADDQART